MSDELVIEFVCTANNGRSPAAQAVAQRYVEEKRLTSRVGVCSSGTHVDSRRPRGIESIVRSLQWVRDSEYLRPEEREKIITFLQECSSQRYERDAGFRADAESFMREISTALSFHERIMRDGVLSEHGLCYNHPPVQTRVRSDVDVVLPMTPGLVVTVNEIYRGPLEVKLPQICGLQEYSGMTGGRFEGTLGRGQDVYGEFFRTIQEAVPKAIERALRELAARTG